MIRSLSIIYSYDGTSYCCHHGCSISHVNCAHVCTTSLEDQTSTCVLIRQFQTFFSSKWLIRLMPNFVNVIINLRTNNDKSNYDKVSLLYM